MTGWCDEENGVTATTIIANSPLIPPRLLTISQFFFGLIVTFNVVKHRSLTNHPLFFPLSLSLFRRKKKNAEKLLYPKDVRKLNLIDFFIISGCYKALTLETPSVNVP